MNIKIHPIPLGAGTAYIIQGDGTVMIDGGMPKKSRAFVKGVERASIRPEDIKLLILTHGHWDHTGSAAEIKEITGARLAMHEAEREWLEKSLKIMPPGVTAWGKVFATLMAMVAPFVRIPAATVDIVLGDEQFSLAEFGIAGTIIHTPGHSPGSVSILLETGDAFVGDLAMNGFPLRIGAGTPIFADDLQKVRDGWRLLLEHGAKTIYPAHGNPFSAEVLRNAL